MFMEIKKHPGVLNEQLEEFASDFLLNLNLIQKAWFRKGELHNYNDKFFKTENLARNEAEGIAHQRAMQDPQQKFRSNFENEMQKIRKVEVDYIRFVILGAQEETHVSIYFSNQGGEEFQRIRNILTEQTMR